MFQNFTTIVLPILVPIGGLLLVMWNDFKHRFDKVDEKFERLGEKIDALRDRVSRIEGQLIPTKVVPFTETKPKEKLKVQG